MSLSNDLISQFVKITKDDNEKQTETTVYGTIKISDGKQYVQIDGSTLYTPISSTTTAKDGDRVTVMIKDHSAVVTGNMSAPSARQESLDSVESDLSNRIDEFGIIVADKVSTDQLDAVKADITDLTAKNATISGKLEAAEADIDTLQADNVTINEKLTAHDAEFESIDATFLTVSGQITAANAKIETLEATDADFRTLESDYATFKTTTTDNFTATNASITNLQTNKLDTTTANATFANIDFSNIGSAAIEEFFSKSGMISDLVVGEGTVTGKLVGVTIVGDLIEGGTVKADKLVILGEDGLYYKLNTNGSTVEAEQTEYNSLNGSHILAQSITASKVNVDDLVAFDATIGGFKITNSSIYSGVKESVDNTTRGIYLDNDGQISFGDADNFVKFYKDSSDNYILEVSASSLKFGASKTDVETAISDTNAAIETSADEVRSEVSENYATVGDVASLQTNAEDLNKYIADVESSLNDSVNTINDNMETLSSRVDASVTSDQVALQIQTELSNGVSKVTTSTGFVFDDTGLTINKTDTPTSTTITENGMVVTKNETGDAVLTANKDGVDAVNLKASTYLIIGTNSRFEDYGTNRTGCFWIGG